MKLALGTAQFGMGYGVANSAEHLDSAHVKSILEVARENDISTLDTAPAYGNSEEVLGSLGVKDFSVISKIVIPDAWSGKLSDWVLGELEGTLSRLRSGTLHGLLIHNPSNLHMSEGLKFFDVLCGLKADGLVENIGISIYTPEDLDSLPPELKFDIVQMPMNIMDRRLERGDFLEKLRGTGAQIHIRSAFLQGLLLLPESRIPVYFDPWRSLLSDFVSWAAENKISPLRACLSYVNQIPEISKIIVGVDSQRQLRQIITAILEPGIVIPDHLQTDDLGLINPSLWKL
jgi:hypothetical protein